MYKPTAIPEWTFINLSPSDPTYGGSGDGYPAVNAQNYGDFHLPSFDNNTRQQFTANTTIITPTTVPAVVTTTTTNQNNHKKSKEDSNDEDSDGYYDSDEYEDEYSDQDPDDKHKGRVTIILYTSAAEMAESEEYVDQMSASMRFSRNVSNTLNLVNSGYSTHTLEWEPIEKKLALSNEAYNGTPQSIEGEEAGRCGVGFLPQCVGGLCTASTISEDDNTSAADYVNHTRKTEIGVLGMGKISSYRPQRRGESKESKLPSPSSLSSFRQRVSNTSKVGDHYVRWDKLRKTSPNAIISCTRPCYCHVEMRLGSYTYSIRWGGKITKTENKKYYNSSMVYTVLNLNLTERSYDRLKAFCDHQWRYAVTRFNHFGVYFNFLAPEFIRKAVCSNGNSYWSGDAVYCSEFLARAFCHIGIFEDMHNVWRSDNSTPVTADLQLLSLFEHDLVLDDEISHLVGKDGRISVDPAMVSPNTLYILLQVKKYLCIGLAARKDSNATLSVDHTIFRGNMLFAIEEGILL